MKYGKTFFLNAGKNKATKNCHYKIETIEKSKKANNDTKKIYENFLENL